MSETIKINRSGSVADIADVELLRRAVQMARAPNGPRPSQPRWVGVMHVFMLGSTYAAELCRRFGFDPYEMVKR